MAESPVEVVTEPSRQAMMTARLLLVALGVTVRVLLLGFGGGPRPAGAGGSSA